MKTIPEQIDFLKDELIKSAQKMDGEDPAWARITAVAFNLALIAEDIRNGAV